MSRAATQQTCACSGYVADWALEVPSMRCETCARGEERTAAAGDHNRR